MILRVSLGFNVLKAKTEPSISPEAEVLSPNEV